ncbi:TetR/AcrR family transcriptional regulator [Streptomyces abikoensis]|uniref:TetR/AcrR family transcriptional regulator n=1 Tax=Streptomyces abikoensis TaxID=97398 RepID=UPI003723CA60
MARPPRYDESDLLDAALRLAAAHGPAAVTMSAVARECGAPSGSVYHRFPQRAVLLAELWLRTIDEFQAGYLAALDSHPQPHEAGGAAARHVVAWSRTHPEQAAVLLYGPDAFSQDEWPEPHARRLADSNRRVRERLSALAVQLGATAAADVERVVLAAVDLPLALVRRHLRGHTPLPEFAEDLAQGGAIDLLRGPAVSRGEDPA